MIRYFTYFVSIVCLLISTNQFILSASASATVDAWGIPDNVNMTWIEITSANGGTYDQFYDLLSAYTEYGYGQIVEPGAYLFTEDVEYVVDKPLNLQLNATSDIMGLYFKVNPGVTVTFNIQPNVMAFSISTANQYNPSDEGFAPPYDYISITAGGDWGNMIFNGDINNLDGYQCAFGQSDYTSLYLKGVTFQNFNNLHWVTNAYSAPITCGVSSTYLKDVIFTGNKGFQASAILNWNGYVFMENVTVTDSSVVTDSTSLADQTGYPTSGQFWVLSYGWENDEEWTLFEGSVTFSGNSGPDLGCSIPGKHQCRITPYIIYDDESFDDEFNDDGSLPDVINSPGPTPAPSSPSPSPSPSGWNTGEVYAAILCPTIIVIAVVALVVTRRNQQLQQNREPKIKEQLINEQNNAPYEQF